MPKSDDFETILTDHLDDMYALAIRLTGSKESAEDLVHDLFVNLSLKRYQNREIRRPKAWLASILYRIFIDQWRRKKNAPVQYWSNISNSEASNYQENIVSLLPRPDQALENDNQQNKLLRALARLNERQQRIVVLHELEGYTLNEIGEIMEIPLGTVKSSLFRAKEKLITLLRTENTQTDNNTNNNDFVPNNYEK